MRGPRLVWFRFEGCSRWKLLGRLEIAAARDRGPYLCRRAQGSVCSHDWWFSARWHDE